MIHTSETVQGQVYFPVVNYSRECVRESCAYRLDKLSLDGGAVAVGTIAMVGGFKNLPNLTNAYGFAVAAVMFVTTSLVAIQTVYTKHLPWILAIAFFSVRVFKPVLFDRPNCAPCCILDVRFL